MSTGTTLPVEDPSTGEVIAHVARGTGADVDAAEELARLETADTGKPLSLARSEIAGCVGYLDYYAGAADKLHGETIPLEQIAPGLVGRDVPSPRVRQQRMDARLAGHGYAKAALDIAVLDLHGQHLGVPVSTLLGGALVDRVPAYASVVVDTPEDSAAAADRRAEEGYPRVQVKLAGRDLERDVETVRQVRSAVGSAVRPAVDPDRGMTVAHALQFDRLTADVPFVLEQPCDTLEEMAQLRGRLDHPGLGVRPDPGRLTAHLATHT